MKLEGDYAVEKGRRVHRIASICVYGGIVGLSLISNGLGQAFKTAAAYLLPLACIWFPEAMASYRGVVCGDGRHVDSPSHPKFLRWAGWFLLLVVPFWLIVMFVVND